MIMRSWRARVAADRAAAYDRFADEVSLPMFRSLEGCEAVFFGREGLEALVVTLWADRAAVEALAETPAYTETAKRIEDEGLVSPGSVVEVFELQGHWAGSPENRSR